MRRELDRQLEAYVEYLEDVAPSLEDIASRARVIRPSRSLTPGPTSATKALSAAVGAALIVVGAIGGAILSGGDGRDGAQPTTTTSMPSTTLAVTSPLQFTLHPAGVIYSGGDGSEGPAAFTGPGGVVVQGDEVHMFRNVYSGDSGAVRHAVSTNGGITFTEDPADVLDATRYRVRSAAIAPGGGWTLYLEATHDASGPPAIVRATADDPSGPFAIDPHPVLVPGAEGSWDSASVGSPSVVSVEGGLVMFFVGKDASGVERIGRAGSADGLTWVKDPVPILEAELDWEGGALTRVDAARVGDTWLMLYAGSTTARRGLAVSGDGLSFRRLARTAVFTVEDLVRPQIRDTELVFTQGGPLLYLENGGARTSSDVILLEGVGDLGG